MTDAANTYTTWHTEPQGDARMAESHSRYWRHFIETIPERDFAAKTVLDFGCNRGGFLQLLHGIRPFRRGVGIDIASESVAVAEANKGNLPVQFHVTTDLSPWADSFDVAFSYEVVYLLPELRRHTEQMFQVMRNGGVYYAVTGCHTENPLWPKWRELIGGNSNAPVQDYSPEDYITAFVAAGFDVSVKRFGYDGFVTASKDRKYYPSILDALAYPAEYKLLFRLEKRV
ncbi:methyltransferase domain-containing protein [Neorhizobium sp. P12A]|uniref:class I SAM-dependent methyltransferase n=1 Tax=Neorhizobium sp. P12A TaxID=2268027 RepID=UPI0011EEFC08|nr:class I SAM-dependent methyltransferase [Neorhizobium sp. P12A]KAA0700381.1 methyltransferase domain-containing protein [Neorhizobium sp. P12A]